MATKSGVVLDYETNVGTDGVTVYAFSTTGINYLEKVSASPGGYFEFSFSNPGTDIIYTGIKDNHNIYSRQLSQNVTYINLFSQYAPTTPNADRTIQLSLHNTGLTTSLQIRDIAATPCHYYIITDNGLDIIDANTLFNVGYIVRSGGYTSIAALPNVCTVSAIHLGTSNSGVYKFNIPTSYDILNRNISSLLIPAYNLLQSNIQSNNIQCMSKNSAQELAVGTPSGIDVYTISGRKTHTYSGATGTDVIYLTDWGDIYYSPTGSGLHVKFNVRSGSGWSSPDYTVLLSGTGLNPFPLLTNYINDIAVTAVSGDYNNHVFLTTPSGFLYYLENANLNISASGTILLRNLP